MDHDPTDILATVATRLARLGYHAAAQELRDRYRYDMDHERPSVILEDILDAEYLSDLSD